MTMDPCIKGLDKKAQPIQGWPDELKSHPFSIHFSD